MKSNTAQHGYNHAGQCSCFDEIVLETWRKRADTQVRPYGGIVTTRIPG